MDSKPFWQSKTFWVSAATLILSLLAFFEGQEWVANNPTIITIIGMASGIIGIILRAITDKPVDVFGRVVGKPKQTRMKY